ETGSDGRGRLSAGRREHDEGIGFGDAAVREVPGRSPARSDPGDLQQPAAQAAARL
ncbi:MAG: LSU ribosomal protein L36p @ LSU ribosomal protein L36p, zinc-dependent, partial [uncultured Thermomicrobiales bacterium]